MVAAYCGDDSDLGLEDLTVRCNSARPTAGDFLNTELGLGVDGKNIFDQSFMAIVASVHAALSGSFQHRGDQSSRCGFAAAARDADERDVTQCLAPDHSKPVHQPV
jgi:hypothetical protein